MVSEIQLFGKDYLSDSIVSGSCVVFIGPDFLRVKAHETPDAVKIPEQSFQQYFIGRLQNENKGIKYYYPKDGLLVFDSPAKKNLLQFQFNSILKSMPPVDLKQIEKLAKIPISFFLSINPDDFLFDTLKSWGYNPRIEYYRGRQHGNITIDKEPTIEEPLIYNLFGSLKEYQSMILDYGDMHNFLQTIFKMPEWGLPPMVSKKIQDASTFIFLGFDFNKWYTQLLLKIIRKDEQTVILNEDPMLDSTVKDFLVQGFEVGFLDSGNDNMLDALIEEFGGTKWDIKLRLPRARKLAEETCMERVRNLIAGNNTFEALDFLESISKEHDEILNNLAMQRGRFNQLKDQDEKRTITSDEFTAGLNEFHMGILGMASDICEETKG